MTGFAKAYIVHASNFDLLGVTANIPLSSLQILDFPADFMNLESERFNLMCELCTFSKSSHIVPIVCVLFNNLLVIARSRDHESRQIVELRLELE